MAIIERLQSLVSKLRDRAAKAAGSNKTVIVGYSAAYAFYVHENLLQVLKGQPRPSGLGVYWGPNGQPKFLEAPARTLRPVLRDLIRSTATQGKTLPQCLLVAGLRLQRESQLLVPVEYGNLRASAFTKIE